MGKRSGTANSVSTRFRCVDAARRISRNATHAGMLAGSTAAMIVTANVVVGSLLLIVRIAEMARNTLTKGPRVITAERSRQIIRIILTHFGPVQRFELLGMALKLGNDNLRQMFAGIRSPLKRTPSIHSLGEYGFPHLLGSMVIAGEIRICGDTVYGVKTETADADDQVRLTELETCISRQKNQ